MYSIYKYENMLQLGVDPWRDDDGANFLKHKCASSYHRYIMLRPTWMFKIMDSIKKADQSMCTVYAELQNMTIETLG